MSRLTEKFIQRKAIEYLKEKYKDKYDLEKIFGRDEVRTNSDYNNKRADGLLCFKSKKNNEHTISIEAKSHKTLTSLLTYWNDSRLALHSIILAIPLSLLIIFFIYQLAWYWISLIVFGTIIVVFFIVLIIISLFELDHYKLINVVSQVHQYPANEKWIAISKDSINLAKKKNNKDFHKKSDFENFLKLCDNQNIGVLVVTRRTIKELILPKYNSGKYLDCYCISNKIRDFIEEN